MADGLVEASSCAGAVAVPAPPAGERAGGILFVTDELFLPRPHNGSAEVYLRAARDRARQGTDIFCLSFFRDRQRAGDPQVAAAYASMFSAFLLLPGWNGGGTLLGRTGLGCRELKRWITGDLFAGNRLLEALLRPRLREVVRFVREHRIDTVYFHKPQTAQLLSPILPELRPARLVIELHDDFVERGLQYQRAYKSFFSSIGPVATAKSHWKSWLRLKFYRVDAQRSRAAEARIMAGCDQVIVASEAEHRQYCRRGVFADKLVYKPRRLARRGRPLLATPEFHAGFIASEDVMNLDALDWFSREILPRIRRERPDFRFLVAGTIARHAARLMRRLEAVRVWAALDDVARFYEAIDIAVVPLRYGTGTSIKVHEALAFGRPVVSTRVGVRGICAAELDGIWIADDADGFSAGVIDRLHTTLGRA